MSPPCLGQQVRRARGSRGNMGLRLPLKARTAQNRRATSRLKRNRCGRSTFGTIRLSFDAYPYLGASLGASLGLAFLAAFWVVSEMFFDEEKLLSSRENELGVAINALQNPVRRKKPMEFADRVLNCSPAVKTNSVLQSMHFKTLSANSMGFFRRHLKSQSVAFELSFMVPGWALASM